MSAKPIPAEIRLGLNTRVPHRLIEGATLSGQGFTIQRMPNPEQTLESINGRSYEIVTFKTAITPIKSGKLEIAAKDAKAIVQIPQRRGNRQRSPFDLFGMDDPFNDPFFNDPLAGMGEQREVKFSSKTTTIDVKPLPPNPPPDFSGAVGHFSLTTEVKPKTAQVGDPLTVTANISGRGNFDAGDRARPWRAIAAGTPIRRARISSRTTTSGSAAPRPLRWCSRLTNRRKPCRRSSSPISIRLKESYVTLKGDKLPVVVEGSPLATATPAIASASDDTATGRRQPDRRASGSGYSLSADRSRSLGPKLYAGLHATRLLGGTGRAVPWLDRIFWLGNAETPPRKSRRPTPRRLGTRNRGVAAQAAPGRRPARPIFRRGFARGAVENRSRLRQSARRTQYVDAETAVAAFDLPDEKRDRVRELFRRSDELRYSGRENGHGTVAEETRREVLELIDSLA